MYQQISSGKRLSTASDDPLGAAQAVTLTMQSAQISTYSTNQTTALSSLQQEDSTLNSVAGVMQSIQSQVVRAGDGSLTDADCQSIASTIQGYRDQLLGLANTTDSNGNYIFSGLKGSTQPFANNPAGTGVLYSGDQGQRTVQISSNRSVPVGDTGTSVFMSVSPSESAAVSSGGNNTGTGAISAVSLTDSNNPNNANTYTIKFGTATDSSLPTTAQPYQAGAKITLGDQTVTISGQPQSGDTFSVTPAASSSSDIFSMLDNLVAALKQPVTGITSAQVNLTNALTTATTKINNSYNNVLAAQTTVGGRSQEVQSQQTLLSTSQTQNKSDLANLTSIDLVSSISSYEMTQNSLQAAQMAFSQIQKMSLFNYLSS